MVTTHLATTRPARLAAPTVLERASCSRFLQTNDVAAAAEGRAHAALVGRPAALSRLPPIV